MFWPCPLPPLLPAHKACIPLHVPVTNRHTDLAKNRVAEQKGNIIFKPSRVSPELPMFISQALTKKISVSSASLDRN